MRALIAFAASAIGIAMAAPAQGQNTIVYGGVQAGYDWSDSGVNIPAYPARFNEDANGAIAGGFGGASWRLNDHWSAGIEADANWSNGRGRHLSGVETEQGPERYQIKQRWTANARVRLSYDISGQTQIYTAIGAAWTNLETRYIPLAGGIDSETVSGWTVAAGAQHDYNNHFFTRAEVRYANYDTGHFFHLGPSSVDMESTSLLLGVGYRFGGGGAAAPPPTIPPSPPPSPPVPACAAMDFVVYFEWDRSNLSQASSETIESAVTRARECHVSAVAVIGHTDTSGTAQYNIGLAARRASIVADALVARGMSTDSIHTEARGESDLARQTGDGVREPLNRRTAVTISFR